jgi:hypothetical protein
MMKTVNNLFVGWLDTSIGSLIRAAPGLLSGYGFVMVTSVDSSTDLVGTPVYTEILRRCDRCLRLGRSLLIPGNQFEEMSSTLNLFNGFDEIWCFNGIPAGDKPHDLWIVAPLNLAEESLPPSLNDWMDRSGCRLGLGDGAGLNYATPDAKTASLLEASPI